jgi:hypothetical protein
MPKKVEGWKKGEGPYSNSDDLKLRRVTQEFSMGKDISKVVDSNAKTDNGFSGALKPDRE